MDPAEAAGLQNFMRQRHERGGLDQMKGACDWSPDQHYLHQDMWNVLIILGLLRRENTFN